MSCSLNSILSRYSEIASVYALRATPDKSSLRSSQRRVFTTIPSAQKNLKLWDYLSGVAEGGDGNCGDPGIVDSNALIRSATWKIL